MTVELSQRIDSWISGYPDRPARRLLHQLPVPLWRLGLQRPIARTFLILTSTGRRSRRPVHTPLMQHRIEGDLYVWCPYGDRGKWCRNVRANPVVTVQDASGTWSAHATRPEDPSELARVHARLLDFDPGQLKRYVESQGIGASAEDFVAHKDRLHVFRLDPTSAPSPVPLEADLVWVWALAPLVALVTAAAARLRCTPQTYAALPATRNAAALGASGLPLRAKWRGAASRQGAGHRQSAPRQRRGRPAPSDRARRARRGCRWAGRLRG